MGIGVKKALVAIVLVPIAWVAAGFIPIGDLFPDILGGIFDLSYRQSRNAAFLTMAVATYFIILSILFLLLKWKIPMAVKVVLGLAVIGVVVSVSSLFVSAPDPAPRVIEIPAPKS